jgi:putative endonuclease
MFFVYILWSEKSHITYVGYTSDLNQRLLSHNILGTKGWTIRHRLWILVEAFSLPSKTEALKLERHFKSGKGRDEIQLILRQKGLKD